MSEFRPSSINIRTVLVGAFGNAEQELAAMCVTNHLAATDANWDTEFSWESFAQWVNDNAACSVNELYVQMLRMFGGDFVVNGIHRLIDRGYISRRDGDDNGQPATFFAATPTFVGVMQQYAA